MAINWSLANGGGFENALATGMAMGEDLRKRREEKEYKNALRQTERTTAELTQKALSGDPGALQQLATVNFDRWKSLDANTKAAAKQESEVFGNAAMDILNRPPEQRAAAVQAYAQQLGQQYPDVMRITQLPPDQLESALRSAVANAGMIGKLHEMEQPRYQAIPEGGTLVDTRNPQAVQQYMGGMGGSDIPTIASPEQARSLPPGSLFKTPDGRTLRVPGGPGATPGNFPAGN